ncbi:MAG: adenosine deaminase [Myxococcaceae bacterium]|nr:adenosine deaminase [Myxococcaceae bacterium]MBH2006551.1 adenosine deaminase [Myxococcaceae bacterium]
MPKTLVDLHIHVGGAVAPHVLFSIAHEQGFKLPVKNYWEFVDLITSKSDTTKNLDDYLKIMHLWTERIQSSPSAIERSVYEIICKEYRSSNVDLIELRFNPMKRNLQGERDLDHIIHAALRGMDRAVLEYGVQACLLFCLAREFDHQTNEIILDKAIKYSSRGVRGIDLAGPESRNLELSLQDVPRYEKLFQKARDAGLKTTIHTGETSQTGAAGVRATLTHLKPNRIGHGIQAAYDPDTLCQLRDSGVVLEICPTSNLHTRAVKDLSELKTVLDQFKQMKIPFTINTDGPYLLNTNMARECLLLIENQILNEQEIEYCMNIARKASFV